MKRRSYQVTRYTKKVDQRLDKMEHRLQNINKMLQFIEAHFKAVQSDKQNSATATITYTVTPGKSSD